MFYSYLSSITKLLALWQLQLVRRYKNFSQRFLATVIKCGVSTFPGCDYKCYNAVTPLPLLQLMVGAIVPQKTEAIGSLVHNRPVTTIPCHFTSAWSVKSIILIDYRSLRYFIRSFSGRTR